MKMNTPNKLTILRMILVPVFMVALLCWNRYVALAIFIVASLTDSLDGHLARKNNEITNFGKFMDPLADKLLVTSALVMFVELGQMPAWVAMVVIARDLAVSGLRMQAASKGIVMAAGWSGKIKTAVTVVCICAMMTPIAELAIGPITVNTVCWVLIMALNLISWVDYFVVNGSVLKDMT